MKFADCVVIFGAPGCWWALGVGRVPCPRWRGRCAGQAPAVRTTRAARALGRVGGGDGGFGTPALSHTLLAAVAAHADGDWVPPVRACGARPPPREVYSPRCLPAPERLPSRFSHPSFFAPHTPHPWSAPRRSRIPHRLLRSPRTLSRAPTGQATGVLVGEVVDVYSGMGTHDTLRVKLRANEDDIRNSRLRWGGQRRAMGWGRAER